MTIPLPTAMAYADQTTVRAGEDITFLVHVDGGGDYRAEFVRLICGDTGPKGPGLKEEVLPSPIDGVHQGHEQITNCGSYVEVEQPPSFEAAVGFEISTLVWPTRPGAGLQILVGRWDAGRGAGWALALDETGAAAWKCLDRGDHVGRWHGRLRGRIFPTPVNVNPFLFIATLRGYHKTWICFLICFFGHPGRHVFELRSVVTSTFTRTVQKKHQRIFLASFDQLRTKQSIMKRLLSIGIRYLDYPIFVHLR